MDTLREIVAVLDRYKVRQIEVITNASPGKESRYHECYVGLREGKWETDEELSKHFGIEPGKPLARFKNEVKKRLYNSVLFVDTSMPEFGDFNRAAIVLTQQWAVAKVLAYKGVRGAFVELAENLLKQAIYFEFLDLVVDILKYMMAYRFGYHQYHKGLSLYQEMFEKYKKAYDIELSIRTAYYNIFLPISTKKGYKKETSHQIRSELDRINDISNLPYLYIQLYYRAIDSHLSMFDNNWNDALKKSRDAKDFFLSKPFRPYFAIIQFSHQEISSLLSLHRYEEAINVCDETIQYVTEHTGNWFKTLELKTITWLLKNEYSKAWRQVKDILRNKELSNIPLLDQETWRVFNGYLSFLAKAGYFELSPREKGEVERFRLTTWLNDLPLHATDKRGANIPIIILQSLYLLMEQRYEEFDNRIEALRKYRQRNLNAEDEHYRTECFIRLLELVPKYHYNAREVRAQGADLLSRLENTVSEMLWQSYEIEVAPYEQQWGWILELLERK